MHFKCVSSESHIFPSQNHGFITESSFELSLAGKLLNSSKIRHKSNNYEAYIVNMTSKLFQQQYSHPDCPSLQPRMLDFEQISPLESVLPVVQDASFSLRSLPYPTTAKSLVGSISLNDCINLLRQKDQLFSSCITAIVFAHSTKPHWYVFAQCLCQILSDVG